MSWQEDVVNKLKQFEGSVNHMYLDSVGLVTVGVGSLLRTADDAVVLPFEVRDGGSLATEEQIREEWQLLADMQQNNYAASYFEPHTQLILGEEHIDKQVMEHLDSFMDGLRKNFADLDDYPQPALMAVMDMTFNLGLKGLISKFPSFCRAFASKDWPSCQAECNRLGIADARNQYVKDLFGQLA